MSTEDLGEEDPHVVSAVAGDTGELEELLREHGPSTKQQLSINSRWRSSLDPEDIMQVTYIEAFLRIGTLRARTADGFRAWLARIARNNLRDALRALGRDKRPESQRRITRIGDSSEETLLAVLSNSDPTAGTIAARREAVSRLRAAIEQLPHSYRQVVTAVDLDERPAAEVAAQMQKSVGAVHMLRSRGHSRLSELLAIRK